MKNKTYILEKLFTGLVLMLLVVFSSAFMDTAYADAKPALILDEEAVSISRVEIEGSDFRNSYLSFVFADGEEIAYTEDITVKNSNKKLVDASIEKEDETGHAYLNVVATGDRTGNAKITVSAPGKRSATVSVKVINPVTSIELSYPKNRAKEVAAGKSLALKSEIASSIGKNNKPTIKKLNWVLQKYNGNQWADVDGNVDDNIKLSGSGKLSVKKNCEKEKYRVYAVSKDGAYCCSNAMRIDTYSPAKMVKAAFLITKGENGEYSAEKIKKNKITFKTLDKADKKLVYYVGIEYSADDYLEPIMPVVIDKTKGLDNCDIRRNSSLSTAEIEDKHYLVYSVRPYEDGNNKKFTFLTTDGTNYKLTLNVSAKTSWEGEGATQDSGLCIVDGAAQPMCKYSNAYDLNYSNENSDILRFCAYVETDVDTDLDGKCDLVKVFMQVPRAAAEGIYEAGVIFDPTPYMAGTREDIVDSLSQSEVDSREKNYPYENIKGESGRKRPEVKEVRTALDQALNHTENEDFNYKYDSYEGAGYDTGFGYTDTEVYNYFLLRGYAVAESAGLGTYGSEGIETCGSVAEKIAFKNIVEWLNGERVAYTDKDATCRIDAKGDFSNGNIAITGCSYGGTMTYALATTGASGIKTIIPCAGIASWYDYTNAQGISKYNETNYRDWLGAYCSSRTFEADNREDYEDGHIGEAAAVQQLYSKTIAAAQISANSIYRNEDIDTTGLDADFAEMINNVWSDADYTKDKDKIKCSALIVHGLNDFNVQRKNSVNMYNSFADKSECRMIFTQDAHGVPRDIKIHTKGNPEGILFLNLMNEWLTHYLYGVNNGILEKLAPVTYQSNVDQNEWYAANNWEGVLRDFPIAENEDVYYDGASQVLELDDNKDTEGHIESQAIILNREYRKDIPEAEIFDIEDVVNSEEIEIESTDEEVLVESLDEEEVTELDDTLKTMLDEANDFDEDDLTGKGIISKRHGLIDLSTWTDEDYLYMLDRNSVFAGCFAISDNYPKSTFGKYYKDHKNSDGGVDILGAPYIEFKAKPDADYNKADRLMLTALLMDYSDKEFEAQMKVDYSDLYNTDETYYYGDGVGNKYVKEYGFDSTRAKVITKGLANFCAPAKVSGDAASNTGLFGKAEDKLYDMKDGKNADGTDNPAEGGELVDEEGYYTYRVYMDTTAYTVAKDHMIIPMIFTYDPKTSFWNGQIDTATFDKVPTKPYGFDIKGVSVHIPFAEE